MCVWGSVQVKVWGGGGGGQGSCSQYKDCFTCTGKGVNVF